MDQINWDEESIVRGKSKLSKEKGTRQINYESQFKYKRKNEKKWHKLRIKSIFLIG
jgi:hypothetical protein